MITKQHIQNISCNNSMYIIVTCTKEYFRKNAGSALTIIKNVCIFFSQFFMVDSNPTPAEQDKEVVTRSGNTKICELNMHS